MPESKTGFETGRPIRFDIERLFGRDEFTYAIPLPTPEKPLRFLSAPNGFGKSTTLRLINDIAKPRWDRVASTLFGTARIAFGDGTLLSITPAPAPHGNVTLDFILSRAGKVDTLSRLTVRPHETRLLREVGDTIQRQVRRGQHGQTYGRTPIWRLQRLHRERELSPADANDSENTLDPLIKEVLQRLVVDYMDTERLVTSIRRETRRRLANEPGSKARPLLAVEDLSNLVNEIVTTSRLIIGQTSSKAERSFPVRVINAIDALDPARPPALDALAKRYASLRKKEQDLQELALIDNAMAAFPAEFLTEHKTHDAAISVVLKEMLDGIEDRLNLLNHVAEQLKLFQRTLNNMLEGKQLQFIVNDNPVSRPIHYRGLEVVDSAGVEIPLRGLSSGEQHLIVMFGRILFQRRLHAGGLILIDEPEISLHPEWQIQLSQALKEVTDLNKCFMLLATHSPTMIGDDWEEEMDLRASGKSK